MKTSCISVTHFISINETIWVHKCIFLNLIFISQWVVSTTMSSNVLQIPYILETRSRTPEFTGRGSTRYLRTKGMTPHSWLSPVMNTGEGEVPPRTLKCPHRKFSDFMIFNEQKRNFLTGCLKFPPRSRRIPSRRKTSEFDTGCR